MRLFLILFVSVALVAGAQEVSPASKAVPTMTAEQAIALARKSAQQQGTQLKNRFLSSVKYQRDTSILPVEMRRFADGPHWAVTYSNPEAVADTHPSNMPVVVLVFPNSRVSIIAPE